MGAELEDRLSQRLEQAIDAAESLPDTLSLASVLDQLSPDVQGEEQLLSAEDRLLEGMCNALADTTAGGAIDGFSLGGEAQASRDAVANRLERRVAALEAENAVLRALLPQEATANSAPADSTGKADSTRAASLQAQAGEVGAGAL